MNVKNELKKILDAKPYQLRALVYIYYFIKLYGKLIAKLLLFRFPVNNKLTSIFDNKPHILQFPVTNKCNLNCKMCGILNVEKNKELEPKQIREILQNKLFENISSVGVNGGEPFLQNYLVEYVEALVNVLPKLKTLYIISNGTLYDRTIATLPQIKALCSSKNIKFVFSISIDGIDTVHDLVRGKKDVFATVEKTCLAINKDINTYCDDFGVLCTLTKYNVYEVNEVDVWAKLNGIKVSYNIATQHERLNTGSLDDDFTVFASEHTQLMAAEFFYGKFLELKLPFYFALYKYVTDKKRVVGCEFKYKGITLLADGSIAYCATKSKIIGNALHEDVNKLYNKELHYKNSTLLSLCDTCSQYGSSPLLFKHHLEYIKETLKNIGSPFKYR